MCLMALCGSRASSIKEDTTGSAVRQGSCVPKVDTHDSDVVASKGCTCLTSAAVTGKVGITCQ
jgi:hypothetical protein